MPILLGLFSAIFFVVGVLTITYVIPPINALLATVWEDPSVRQRRKVLARLKELHVDGTVPAETAVLMTAKELNVTEQQLLSVAGLFSAGEIKGLFTGRQTLLSIVFNKISKHMFSRASGNGGTFK